MVTDYIKTKVMVVMDGFVEQKDIGAGVLTFAYIDVVPSLFDSYVRRDGPLLGGRISFCA